MRKSKDEDLMLLRDFHRDVLRFMSALHEQNLRMAKKLRMYGDKGEYLSSKIVADKVLDELGKTFDDISGKKKKLKLVGGND